jgi:hypothetical protein
MRKVCAFLWKLQISDPVPPVLFVVCCIDMCFDMLEVFVTYIFQFLCGLLNEAFCVATIRLQMISDELERIWKGSILA